MPLLSKTGVADHDYTLNSIDVYERMARDLLNRKKSPNIMFRLQQFKKEKRGGIHNLPLYLSLVAISCHQDININTLAKLVSLSNDKF